MQALEMRWLVIVYFIACNTLNPFLLHHTIYSRIVFHISCLFHYVLMLFASKAFTFYMTFIQELR